MRNNLIIDQRAGVSSCNELPPDIERDFVRAQLGQRSALGNLHLQPKRVRLHANLVHQNLRVLHDMKNDGRPLRLDTDIVESSRLPEAPDVVVYRPDVEELAHLSLQRHFQRGSIHRNRLNRSDRDEGRKYHDA